MPHHVPRSGPAYHAVRMRAQQGPPKPCNMPSLDKSTTIGSFIQQGRRAGLAQQELPFASRLCTVVLVLMDRAIEMQR
jgi:hypothetical protein